MSVTDDRGDLIELIHRLYACTDDGRFDDLRSVFSEGVKAGAPGGGVVEGQDRLITTLSAAHSTGQRSQHLVHNVLVDVHGDQASVRADVIAIHCDSDKPEGRIAPEPGLTLSLRLRYEAIRSSEGWRVSRIDGDLLWASNTQPQAVPAS